VDFTNKEKLARAHCDRHITLHNHFDELVADFLRHNAAKRPSNTTVLELMQWSAAETVRPTEVE
jgi:hypothetical protein